MERMLEAPERETMLLADEDGQPSERVAWWQSLHATSTRRALLLTALGGLLIAGLITALPSTDGSNGLTASTISLGPRGNDTFNHAKSGDCLNWPDRTPDAAEIVDCKDEHRFEVAESVDMRTFPGSEYGPDAAPPSPARIQQISQEQCSAAVKRYLGARFDPNSRFTVSMLWSGDKAWRQSGERRMLCGLQLPGPNNQQLAFKGKVADVDQSKVWPAGTCLGIDPSTNQPTDIPFDCAAPHAMEVTGAVNLAEKFPQALPPEPDQDAVHQGRLHPDDGCLPGADPVAQHHADPDLQHHLAAELVGRQPSGVVQHRRDPGQRRLVDAAQQRQGPADDQRSAAGRAARHPRGAAEPAADSDPEPQEPTPLRPHLPRRRSRSTTSQTDHGQQTRSTCPGNSRRARPPPRPPDTRRGAPPPQGNTFLNGPPPPAGLPPDAPPPPDGAPPPQARASRPGSSAASARRPRRRRHPRRGRRLPSPLRRHRHRGSSRVAVRMSPQRFDELVSDALDLIPPELAAAIDNVVVLVEDRNPEEPDLLGLYQGVALTERDSWYAGSLPDTITIYRDALLDVCEDEDEVVDEVAITVIHEIAHHFGIDDDRLHELGWGISRPTSQARQPRFVPAGAIKGP